MRIEFDPAQAADWAAGQPTWVLVVAAVHAWYLAAGIAMRRLDRCFDNSPPGPHDASRGILWAISPFIFTVLAIGVIVWLSSGGYVPPPWRWFE